MSMVFDTPQDIAFVRACSRKGALALEIKGLKHSGRGRSVYSIVKEVYGFRGSRQSVLEDLTEYIECEIRIRKLPEDVFTPAVQIMQEIAEHLGDDLTQSNFESTIAYAEQAGSIDHDMRQALSDLFYVSIVRQNAGYR